MRHVARAEQLFLPATFAVEHLKALDFARFARIGDDAHHAGGLERAFQHLGGRRAREARRARPQRDLGLARSHARAHAYAEDPQVVGALQIAKRAAQRLGGLSDGVMCQRAGQRLHHIGAALLVKSQIERALRVPLRAQFQLVAVPPLALGGQAQRHQLRRRLAEAARAGKRRHHVGAFGLKLRVVGDMLPRGCAACRGLGPLRHHAARAGLFKLGDAGACERGLVLDHLHACHIARGAAFHEHGLAVGQVPDRFGAVAHALDGDGFGHVHARFFFGPIRAIVAYNWQIRPSSSVG